MVEKHPGLVILLITGVLFVGIAYLISIEENWEHTSKCEYISTHHCYYLDTYSTPGMHVTYTCVLNNGPITTHQDIDVPGKCK